MTWAPVALAANGPISLGRFQSTFEFIRPYIMVAFVSVGLYVLVVRLWASLIAALSGSHKDGHSVGDVARLMIFVGAVEVFAWALLWYGIDVLNAIISIIQASAT
jgi:hypothetical protein